MAETTAQAGHVMPDLAAERRRAGRMENASPELIALMRRPSAEARRAVLVFDAPNFRPPSRPVHRGRARQQRMRLIAATSVCTGACAAAFGTMLWIWN